MTPPSALVVCMVSNKLSIPTRHLEQVCVEIKIASQFMVNLIHVYTHPD